MPLIYCSIVYFMTDQPKDGHRYMQYIVITILTCLVAQSIGLLLGAVAPNVPVRKCYCLFFHKNVNNMGSGRASKETKYFNN